MRLILCALFLLFSMTASSVPLASIAMLSGQTSTGYSSSFEVSAGSKSYYAKGTTSAGSGAATIIIEGSNVDSAVATDWITMGTITLTLGTTSAGDGFPSDAHWRYVRAHVSAISGTTATVYVYVASEARR